MDIRADTLMNFADPFYCFDAVVLSDCQKHAGFECCTFSIISIVLSCTHSCAVECDVLNSLHFC